jgi:hypothetical protein
LRLVPGLNCSGLAVAAEVGWRVGSEVLGRGEDVCVGGSMVRVGPGRVVTGIGSIWIASVPHAEMRRRPIIMPEEARILGYFIFLLP